MNLYNRQKFISSDYKNIWPTFVFAKLLCVQQSNDITMRSKRTVTCLKYRSTFQTISSLLSIYCNNTLLFSGFLSLRIIYLLASQIHLSIHLSDSNRVTTVCQAPYQTVWRMLYKIIKRLFQTLSSSHFRKKMCVQLPLVSMEDWIPGSLPTSYGYQTLQMLKFHINGVVLAHNLYTFSYILLNHL